MSKSSSQNFTVISSCDEKNKNKTKTKNKVCNDQEHSLLFNSQHVHLHVLKSTYLSKICYHLLHKRFHGCNINSFEFFKIDGAVKVNVLADLSQDG